MRIALILVEGLHDLLFIEKLLSRYGISVSKTELRDLYNFVRLQWASRRELAVGVCTYAEHGGVSRASRVAAALARYVARSRDLARDLDLGIAIVSDENHSRDRNLESISVAMSKELPQGEFSTSVVEQARYLAIYEVKRIRTSKTIRVSVSFVECSLECRVAKHVLKNYSAFCNPPRCRELLHGSLRNFLPIDI